MKKSKQSTTKEKKSVVKSGIILGSTFLVLFAGILFYDFNKPSAPPEKPSKVEKLKFSQATAKEAPDFTLQDIYGKTIKLSDYRGKIVVLFFNEGAMCYPACWDQMTAFVKDERFNTSEIETFSIVIDQKSEWEKIVSQVPDLSKAKILFDSDREVSAAYDVLSLPSSMHPPSAMHPGGYPGHTYFVIDKEGIVRFTFDDPKMGIRNDLLISELSKLGG